MFKEDLGTLEVVSNEVTVTISGNWNMQKLLTYDGKEHSTYGFGYESDNDLYDKVIWDSVQYKGMSLEEAIKQGGAVITGTDAGTYYMNLKPEDFTNTDERFNVTFVVESDVTMTIHPRKVDVHLRTNSETVSYDGTEKTLDTYHVEAIKYPFGDGPDYTESDFTYNGVAQIKATAIGTYTEEVSAEDFVNNNSNFDAVFEVHGDPACLTIQRMGVVVKLKANSDFEMDYDGKVHTLKVEAGTNKVLLDGVEQEGPAFEVASVTGAAEDQFDPSKIYLRSDITVSGTDSGDYYENKWYKRLSYDDPSIIVEFDLDDYRTDTFGFTVKAIPITLVVDDKEMEYGREMPEFTAHWVDLPEACEEPEFDLDIEFEDPDAIHWYPLDPGTYKISATRIMNDGNFYVTVEWGKLTVSKRNVTVTVHGEKRVERQNPDGKPNYVKGYSFTSDDDWYPTGYSTIKKEYDGKEYAERTEPGTTYMGLTPDMFENTDANFNVTYVIDDGYITVVDADAAAIDLGTINLTGGEYVYDGAAHGAVLENEEITVDGKTYTLSASILYDLNGSKVKTPRDAGDYTASISRLTVCDENGADVTSLCEWNTGGPAAISIAKRPVTIQITGSEVKKPYTGKEQTATVYSAMAHDELADLDYEPTDGMMALIDDIDLPLFEARWIKYDGTGAKGTAIGNYPMELSADLFRATSVNYDATFVIVEDGNLEIVPKDEMITLDTPTGVNETITYDGEYHGIPRTIKERQSDGSLALTGSDGNTYYVVKTSSPSMRLELFRDPGEYTWYKTFNYKKVVDENGTDVTALISNRNGHRASGVFTIAPVTVTITVKDNLSKTYGDPDPDPSTWYDITIDSDTMTVQQALTVAQCDDIMPKRVAGENVGMYQIRVDLGFWLEAEPWDPGEVEKDNEQAKKVAAKSAEAMEALERVPESAAWAAEEVRPGGSEVIWPGEGEDEWESTEKATEAKLSKTRVQIDVDDEDKFFTINKANLKISADYQSKDYGTDDPTLTATVSKGLVGSEVLPDNFYEIWRDPGEEIKSDPGYPIHVKAPNANDFTPDQNINRFDDEEAVAPEPDPGEYDEQEQNDDQELAEHDWAEHDWAEEAEEAVAMEEAAKEDWAEAKEEAAKEDWAEAKEEAAKEEVAYAKKSVKAVERAAEQFEARYDYLEKVEAEERLDDLARPELEYLEEAEQAEQAEDEDIAAVEDEEYIPHASEFDLRNYYIETEDNELDIFGETTVDTPVDPTPDPDTPPTGGGGGNGGGNGGGTTDGGDDLTVADIGDNPTPTAPSAPSTINDPATPLAGGGDAAWALVNLICTILTALGAIVAIFRRKEEEDEDEEQKAYKAQDDEEADNRGKKMFAAKTAGVLSAIAAVITFILTEDMRLPMIMIDRWTLLMVIILAVQIVAAVLNKKASENEEDEDAQTQTAN